MVLLLFLVQLAVAGDVGPGVLTPSADVQRLHPGPLVERLHDVLDRAHQRIPVLPEGSDGPGRVEGVLARTITNQMIRARGLSVLQPGSTRMPGLISRPTVDLSALGQRVGVSGIPLFDISSTDDGREVHIVPVPRTPLRFCGAF